MGAGNPSTDPAPGREARPTRPRRVWPQRAWSRRLAVALLGLELLYVAAFEIAARTGRIERWINRRPEKAAITLAEAHSWFPFQATVRGLDLRVQTSRLRWRLQVDEGDCWISPLALLGRRLRFATIGARGVSFQMRRERPPSSSDSSSPGSSDSSSASVPDEPRDESLEALLPQLPDLAPPPATPRPERPKWSFEFPRVAVAEGRELWMDRLRLTGKLAGRGGGALHHGIEAEVFASALELADGRLALGRFEVASAVRGRVEIEVARWPFREKRGLQALPFVSGGAAVEGNLTIGSFLRASVLPPWFRFDHQPAPFSARTEVRSGALQPGTRLEMQSTACQLALFDFGATGQALARFEVTADASGPRADVDVRFRDFEVRRADDPRAEIVGTGLRLLATSRDLALHPPPYVGTARFDLGEARLADLALYNDLVPPSLPLSIRGGSGTLRGGLELTLPSQAARASFKTEVGGAAVRYGELDLEGDVAVELALRSDRLASGAFDLAGTRLALTDFRSPQAEAAGPRSEAGWWARIEVPEGRLKLPPEPGASGRFVVKLRDSVPLVGLFATRKDLPAWVEEALSVRDVEARGRFAWAREGAALEDLATRFRQASLRGRARFGKHHRTGVMLLEWWKLALGARFDDDRHHLALTAARDWYAAQQLGR